MAASTDNLRPVEILPANSEAIRTGHFHLWQTLKVRVAVGGVSQNNIVSTSYDIQDQTFGLIETPSGNMESIPYARIKFTDTQQQPPI